MSTNGKSSAQLEAEVQQQRQQLETDIDEIQRRLAPGQITDELLSYARSSGGSEFVGNLSRSVRTNPLPVLLTAVGLGWLMLRSNAPVADTEANRLGGTEDVPSSGSYPVAPIKGSSLRRMRQATDEAGRRYSEFADEAGNRFKATSDELGNRAGHFADQAGTLYRGFSDEAGNRVSSFIDEAGSRLADAQGWAADSWDNANSRLSDLQDSVSAGAGELRRRASATGGMLQDNAGSLTDAVNKLLHDQPLVGGAIAFAIGAAIASALPPTTQEDQLVGEASDQVKERGRQMAGDVYQKGKQQVSDAFEQTRDEASAVYANVKEDLTSGTRPGSVH